MTPTIQPSPTVSPTVTNTPESTEVPAQVALAFEHLSQNILGRTIEPATTEYDWSIETHSDAGLGCAPEGVQYPSQSYSAYRIRIVVAAESYDYRVSEDSSIVIYCINNDAHPSSILVDSPQATEVAADVCQARSTWQSYTIESGDTLASIALETDTTAGALQRGNCLASRDAPLTVGDTVRVPTNPVPAASLAGVEIVIGNSVLVPVPEGWENLGTVWVDGSLMTLFANDPAASGVVSTDRSGEVSPGLELMLLEARPVSLEDVNFSSYAAEIDINGRAAYTTVYPDLNALGTGLQARTRQFHISGGNSASVSLYFFNFNNDARTATYLSVAEGLQFDDDTVANVLSAQNAVAAAISANQANARISPNSDADVAEVLPGNTPVLIRSILVNGDGETWYAVDYNFSGISGSAFVLSDIVDVNQADLSGLTVETAGDFIVSPFNSSSQLMSSNVIDIINGGFFQIINASPSDAWDISTSPDGDFVVIGGADDRAYVLNATGNGSVLYTIDGHTQDVSRVAWSPAGDVIATGSEDNSVRLWRASDGAQLQVMQPGLFDVFGLAFNPDGDLLAASYEDGSVRVFDVYSGVQLLEIEAHKGIAWTVQFAPSGNTVVSAGDDSTIVYSDPYTGAEQISIDLPEGERAQVLRYSDDGRRLAVGTNQGQVFIYDARTLEGVGLITGYENEVWGLDLSNDGSAVVVAARLGNLDLWDTATGQQILVWSTGSAQPWAVSISADGSRLAASSGEGAVRVLTVR